MVKLQGRKKRHNVIYLNGAGEASVWIAAVCTAGHSGQILLDKCMPLQADDLKCHLLTPYSLSLLTGYQYFYPVKNSLPTFRNILG